MSFTATYNAFQISGISKAEQHILSGICTFADRNTGICWPTVETIANRCRSSVRTVQTHINALVSKGLLQRIYRPNRPALTKVLIPLTHTLPAISAPLEVQFLRGEPDIQPINQRAAPPATPEPSTETANAAFVVVSVIEQPDQAPAPGIESLPDYSAQLQVFANSQYAPTEATETPYSAPNEADKAIHTLDPATPVVEAVSDQTQDQAIESAEPLPTTIQGHASEADQADPAMAEWSKIDPMVLLSIMEIRKAKRKAPKPNPVEIKHWYSVALAANWTLPQIAYAMCLRGWSRIDDASWLTGMIPPQMTATGATGAPAAPAAPKLWQPTPHTPASPSTVAKMKEQIAAMKQRWREEPLKARPMRQ